MKHLTEVFKEVNRLIHLLDVASTHVHAFETDAVTMCARHLQENGNVGLKNAKPSRVYKCKGPDS